MKKEEKSDNILFYTDLFEGKEKRGLWGKNSRFSPEKIANHPSVRKYLIPIIKSTIRPSDKVLDFGCGPGSFFPVVAPHCLELKGIDVVPAFVEAANGYVNYAGIKNASAYSFEDLKSQVGLHYFDVIIMIDVIHHVENLEVFFEQVKQMLKRGGGGNNI